MGWGPGVEVDVSWKPHTYVGAERDDFLEIRVGIHCGNITCGVLGKLQPRFQVFGSAVNMAARMEQSGIASQVRPA